MEPNSNDITHIANIVLNEVPNSNDTMCVVNNVRLGAQQFLIAANYIAFIQKRQITRDEK